MRPLSPGMLDLIHNGMQIASLAAFVIFIALGLRVAHARGAGRRGAINALLLYAIGVHAVLIAVQKDAWPFSVYPMMAFVERDPAATHVMLSARAVDASGREWPVDSLAWSPLYPPSTLAWFDLGYPTASRQQRNQVMQFLLNRAEGARKARARGDRFIGNRALLGPFAAPDTNLYWTADAPPAPFHSLRIYRVLWNPRTFFERPSRVARTLVCEFPS